MARLRRNAGLARMAVGSRDHVGGDTTNGAVRHRGRAAGDGVDIGGGDCLRTMSRGLGLLCSRAVSRGDDLSSDVSNRAINHGRRAAGDCVDARNSRGDGLGTGGQGCLSGSRGNLGDRADSGVQRNSLGGNITTSRAVNPRGALGNGVDLGRVDGRGGQVD